MALFYDDSNYARAIEFWYILNGLQREEHCIYTTHGNPKIVEREMRGRGIDVDTFKRKKLLHVCKISDPLLDPKGRQHGIRRIMDAMFMEEDCKPPLRIVSRFVRRTATEREIRGNIRIDSEVQEAIKHKKKSSPPPLPTYAPFENFRGSLICPYPLNDVLTPRHRKWVTSHLQSHDAVIFAPRSGSGFVLTSSIRHSNATID